MTFLRPDLAPWALVVPALAACWLAQRAIRVAFRSREAVAPRFRDLSRRSGTPRDTAMLAAGVLAAALTSLALMRPQAPLTRRTPQFDHQDLIVVLDRSASMMAQDIAPSRLARATDELRGLIRRKPPGVDRVALVAFADTPVVLSYLTSDADSLLFYFDWLDADPTPFFGTNIGAALDVAMAIARKDERRSEKIVLVVSDGEDFGSELTAAIGRARTAGLQVNTIGVGGDQSVPIHLRAAGGGHPPLVDDTGRLVTTRFSEGTLRRIASATGGTYLRSTTGTELQQAIAALATGGRIVGWRTSTERRDLYPFLLAAAALAVACLWVLA